MAVCTTRKIETVKQALEETKHIKMLASLGKRLDYAIKTRSSSRSGARFASTSPPP